MTRGIDVSVYQGRIDWDKVRGAGVEWVMVKAMQGVREADNFSDNLTGAFSRYLRCGAYHFLTAKTVAEADAQMDALLYLLARYRPLIKLYVAIDVEAAALPRDKALLTDIVRLCYDRIEAAGYRAIVYTNPDWLRNRLEDISDLRLWLACWRGKGNVPSLTDYPNLSLWQWGTEFVDGITGEVDANYLVADDPIAAAPPPRFSDVAGHWAADAIESCADAGLLKGRSDGRFCPDEPLTRAEAATIIARLVEMKGENK